MKTNCHCVSPDDGVEQAARVMRDQNVGFVPICDSEKRVVGTITDRDITIRVVAEGKNPTTKCSEVMTRQVIACRPEDNLLRAEQLMSQHRKSRIVCVDEDGRLAGIISLSDIAQIDNDRHVARTMREVTDRESYTIH